MTTSTEVISPLRQRMRGCRSRLQLMPQPTLPKVQGHGRTTVVRRTPGRSSARRVLPRGLHTTGPDQRDCVLQQGGDVRPVV